MLSHFPLIDYEKHPAFPHGGKSRFEEGALATHVSALDELCAAVEQGRRGEDLGEVLGEVDNLLVGITSQCSESGMPAVVLELAFASIQRAGEELKAWLHFAVLRRYAAEGLSDRATAASLSELNDRGCCTVQVSPASKRRFLDACQPLIDELRRRQPQHSVTRNCLEVEGAAIRTLRSLVRDSGADKIIERYLGSKLAVGAGIELSHAAQRWDENIYQAEGVPRSKLRYLHTDESPFVPKAMLYLTPMAPESGPISFIPGSNRAKRSEFQQTFFKAFDRITTERFLPVTGGRYRPFFRQAETRALFMSLPRLLRGTSHFGDDLINGEPLERDLSSMETPFLDTAGCGLCLFDGARTLHRGSNVVQGARIGVQLGFFPVAEKRVRLRMKGADGVLQRARLLYRDMRKYF